MTNSKNMCDDHLNHLWFFRKNMANVPNRLFYNVLHDPGRVLIPKPSPSRVVGTEATAELEDFSWDFINPLRNFASQKNFLTSLWLAWSTMRCSIEFFPLICFRFPFHTFIYTHIAKDTWIWYICFGCNAFAPNSMNDAREIVGCFPDHHVDQHAGKTFQNWTPECEWWGCCIATWTSIFSQLGIIFEW